MSKTDRQFAIARLLRQPKTFDELWRDLSDEGFRVSARTLRRDQSEMAQRGDLLFVGRDAKLTTESVTTV